MSRRSVRAAGTRPAADVAGQARQWRRGLRRTLGLACAFVVVLAAGAAAEVPEGATWTPRTIASADGTRIRVDVLRPKGLRDSDRTPVIAVSGPYFGTDPIAAIDSDPAGSLTRSALPGPTIPFSLRPLMGVAFERGYSVVLISPRGYGGSGGCIDLHGAGEQSDTVAGLRWAMHQPWSTGKVGMWGISYEGTTQVIALAHRVPIDAAVIESPLVDGYNGAYMNGVRMGMVLAPPLYAAYDAAPATPDGTDTSDTGSSVGSTNPRCGASLSAATLAHDDDAHPFWRERRFSDRIQGSTVPVLTSQGFRDGNVAPVRWPRMWKALAGPKRAWLGHFAHVSPGASPDVVGRDGFLDEAMRWMDRYVKGVPAAQAPVEDDPVLTIQEGADGRWREERAWPPSDAFRYRLPLLSGEYVDAPGNKAEVGCWEPQPGCGPGAAVGRGSWTFTPALQHDAHVSGVPRLRADVDVAASDANLIAVLYDIAPDGTGLVVAKGAYRLRRDGPVEFDLYPIDWTLAPGHRLGVLLTSADDIWFLPGTSGSVVRVRGGHVDVPLLRHRRTFDLEGGPGPWIGEQRRRITFPPLVDPAQRTADIEPPPQQVPASGGPRR